jgi:hypothetical protein
MNLDVHGLDPNCDVVTCASRFLIGLVTRFSTHAGMPADPFTDRSRYTLGGTPTNSENRVLNVPNDEQPTVKQTSVTVKSPRRNNAIARSIRLVIRYE